MCLNKLTQTELIKKIGVGGGGGEGGQMTGALGDNFSKTVSSFVLCHSVITRKYLAMHGFLDAYTLLISELNKKLMQNKLTILTGI